MGAGASMDPNLTFLDSASNEGDRYFCHSCHRVFGLVTNEESREFMCPHCQSTFLEEIGESSQAVARRHNHGQLSSDQARRISNATAMLRLLESQLREELESLQQAFATASARMNEGTGQNKQKTLTKVMTSRLRNVTVNLDMACSQPSCPICNEDFYLGNNALRMPCSHIFHEPCVMPWLEMKQNCPICRAELSDVLPTELELEPCSVIELKSRLREFEYDDESMADKEKSELITMLMEKYKEVQEAEAKSAADAASEFSSAVSFPIVLRSNGSGSALGTSLLHPRPFLGINMSPNIGGFGISEFDNAPSDTSDPLAMGIGFSGPSAWQMQRRAIPFGGLQDDNDDDDDDDGNDSFNDNRFRFGVRYIPSSASRPLHFRRPWELSTVSSSHNSSALREEDDSAPFGHNTTNFSTSSPFHRALSSSATSTAGTSVTYQIVPRAGGSGGYSAVAMRSTSLPAADLANILLGGRTHTATVHDSDEIDTNNSSPNNSHR